MREGSAASPQVPEARGQHQWPPNVQTLDRERYGHERARSTIPMWTWIGDEGAMSFRY